MTTLTCACEWDRCPERKLNDRSACPGTLELVGPWIEDGEVKGFEYRREGCSQGIVQVSYAPGGKA